jgi:hypothetical protein
MVTLTTGIMFLLFTCMQFWAWGILPTWTAIADSLRNTALYRFESSRLLAKAVLASEVPTTGAKYLTMTFVAADEMFNLWLLAE